VAIRSGKALTSHLPLQSCITDFTRRASGYSAYEKLSPGFRKLIDGQKAIYKSAHTYLDRDDPASGPKHIERVHPIVRVHPATGWKALWVNRAFTKRIVGLDQAESDVILNYLFDVYEKVSPLSGRQLCPLNDERLTREAECRHPVSLQVDAADECLVG